MSDFRSKILPVEHLAKERGVLGEAGKTVVQCHGCFDLVHPGHIRYLQFAKSLGDILIVSVSGDRVVGKGPARPFIGEELRAENLAVLEFVDYVCIDDHEWAGPILETLRPDVYVKGKEYETKGDPRFVRELQLVEGYGGKVVFSSGEVIYSSTHLLEQFSDRFELTRVRLEAFCGRHAITRASLHQTLADIAGARVLVLGDPILDHYVHCDALGIASETPILSVTPIREEWFLGAGALIASQMAGLGADVAFLTSLQDSPHVARFREQAAERGIKLLEVGADERPLALKTRFLVDNQKVFKVNSQRMLPLSTNATSELISKLEENLRDRDALVVTDFGYGLFNADVIDAVARIAEEQGKPYYLDVSHTRRASILKFRKPRLATPTEQELRFAFADNEAGLSNLASRFFSKTGAAHLLLTMGRRGVLLFAQPSADATRIDTDFLPALEGVPLDPVGAGDVFLSAVALSDLVGRTPQQGAYLGAALAALHVSSIGNNAVDSTLLHRYLDSRSELGDPK